MGIFEGLFASLRGKSSEAERTRILEHWGVSEAVDLNEQEASQYDRTNWRKKLQRILDELPASEEEWKDFLADAYALGFDERWIEQTLREEFKLLVRRAVADHVVTDAEHRKLDLAHQLIGLTDNQAEAIFTGVVNEAETFFGTKIRGS